MEDLIIQHLEDTAQTVRCMRVFAEDIRDVAQLICDTLKTGYKLVIFGNGGSAADAQHFAAELTGRYKKERKPLPAIALTTDTSALTAIGNDYGYEKVFERQVRALVQDGDVVVGISTSGNSANVLLGMEAAKRLGAWTIGLTGGDGGKLKKLAVKSIVVPSSITAHIQEVHIAIIHAICGCIDANL